MKLSTVSFSEFDTPAETARKLNALLIQLQARLDVDSVRVGDTTKLDHDGTVTVGAFTMAEGAAADEVLTCDADGVASWEPMAAAGNDTEVQYNSSGAFAGSAYLVFNVGGKELRTRVFQAVDTTGVKLYNANSQGIQVGNAYGHVGINCAPGPTSDLDINGDTIRLRTSQTPLTAGGTGKAGMIAWDGDYIYVCVATDTWKRSSIATW